MFFRILMGIFTVIGFVMLPFILIGRWLGFGTQPVPPEILEEYNEVVTALREGDLDFLSSYAKRTPDFPNGKDAFIGRYWMTNAIDLGTVETVQWFLDQGCEVNYQDDEGYSPLKSAIARDEGSLDVVMRLIQAGADINAKGTLDETLLHAAAVHGSPDVVQYLLDNGADPFAWDTDYTPSQPIDFAAQNPENAAVLRDYMNKHPHDDKGNIDE